MKALRDLVLNENFSGENRVQIRMTLSHNLAEASNYLLEQRDYIEVISS